MKITKRNWFFHLLGLLALMLVFGVMFTGCAIWPIGGGVVGVIIAYVISEGYAIAMGLGLIAGLILGGIIGFLIDVFSGRSISSSGSSSSSSSSGFSATDYINSRKNDPHTCNNCTKYSSPKGMCRLDGSSKSAGDSCSNWC